MLSHLRALVAPVIASLLIVGVAQGALYQWSKTASSNSSADPTINWAEGMSPSSVNDSARAMMARVAEWRDDISGALTTAGTASAYTLTTNQVLPSTPENGQMISFRPHVSNNASATLRADGGTVYPIRTDASTAVQAGVLVAGAPYSVMFNSSASAWILKSYFSSTVTNMLVPIGGIIPYAGTAAPSANFVFPYGQCISRTTYSDLFSAFGTTYDACDGTTTFGLPDLRGRVVAGKDNMGGTAAGRLTGQPGGVNNGSALGGNGGAETHTLTLGQMPAHTHTQTAQQPTFKYTTGNVAVGGNTAVDTITAAGAGNTLTTTGDSSPGNTASSGSGSAHNNVQPTIVLNMLIRIL